MPAACQLIVSFHDLHPGSRVQCERFLAMCRECGVERTTLLVVPRWHGAPPCDEDREFAAWLRERAEEGHEICLHAYLHRAEAVTGNAVQRAMGKHYTAGEGEFYQIDEAEAATRLREGLRIVRDGCGVPVWGFTAPAWLLSDGGRAALRKLGFHYTTRWGQVELLQSETAAAVSIPEEPVIDRSYSPACHPRRSGLQPDSPATAKEQPGGACPQASSTAMAGPSPGRLQASSYNGHGCRGRNIAAPVLVWSTRAAWRRVCSRGWVRLWGAWKRRSSVLRVAVHPVDFAYPSIEASVREAIARNLCGREAACYRDLLPEGTPPLGGGK